MQPAPYELEDLRRKIRWAAEAKQEFEFLGPCLDRLDSLALEHLRRAETPLQLTEAKALASVVNMLRGEFKKLTDDGRIADRDLAQQKGRRGRLTPVA